jgi:Winged helix-turn helix
MRGPPVCLRDLTAEERASVETLARSHTAPAQRVERARLIWRAGRGETPPSITVALGVSADMMRRRIRRFNAEGLAAFDDHHRSGRPATYSAERACNSVGAGSPDRRSARLLARRGGGE